jgi:hypothetical protein
VFELTNQCLYGHTPFLAEEGGRQQTKMNILVSGDLPAEAQAYFGIEPQDDVRVSSQTVGEQEMSRSHS